MSDIKNSLCVTENVHVNNVIHFYNYNIFLLFLFFRGK